MIAWKIYPQSFGSLSGVWGVLCEKMLDLQDQTSMLVCDSGVQLEGWQCLHHSIVIWISVLNEERWGGSNISLQNFISLDISSEICLSQFVAGREKLTLFVLGPEECKQS